MTLRRSLALMTGVVSVFTLSACGEGWVPQKYTGFPYEEERTAGSGVEYVRARLLPEKGPILVPVETPAPDVMKDAEPLLERKLDAKK